MNYKIKIKAKAMKFIEKQPKDQKERIFKAIYKLPKLGDISKLKASDMFRLRVGDYRILFTIDDDILLIEIINANNRGDVYKNL